MRHIQKIGTPFEPKGKAITQTYLDNRWQRDHYAHLSYSRTKLPDMDALLVQEQKDATTGQSYCCYCMRRLFLNAEGEHEENVTLEHIVPNHIDTTTQKDDIAKYQRYPCLDDNHLIVCHGGELPPEMYKTKITELPYPHFVSYHNLVASCNGSMFESGNVVASHCCNNNRKNRYIDPFFLDSEKTQYIQYNQDGTLDYDDSTIETEWFDKQHLNLSADWLRLVRHLWYLVAQSVYTAEQVEEAISNIDLRQVIIDDIDSENLIAAWADETKTPIWTLFAEYNWFYFYYQNK